jgi:hypothetical protein
VQIGGEYYNYLVEDNPRELPPSVEELMTFARACRWCCDQSIGAEVRSRHAGMAFDADPAGARSDDQVVEDLPAHELSGGLGRHVLRLEVLVDQLVQLASVPLTVLGDYDCHFPHEDTKWARFLRPRHTCFKMLPRNIWPENPGIPPFIVTSGHVFSPRLIAGLVLDEAVQQFGPRQFQFRVPQWLLKDCGWHNLRGVNADSRS